MDRHIDLTKLREPFPKEDIEWRIQASGERNGRPWARVLAYVTVRAIHSRLDEVCGPENWRNETPVSWPAGGVVQGISIRINGEWITKWDGAENTDIEAVKGGLSSSFKRAAALWGIGRYLYALPEGFANVSENGEFFARTREGHSFRWDPPEMPIWALPKAESNGRELKVKNGAPVAANQSPKAKDGEGISLYDQFRTMCIDLGRDLGVDMATMRELIAEAAKKYGTTIEKLRKSKDEAFFEELFGEVQSLAQRRSPELSGSV